MKNLKDTIIEKLVIKKNSKLANDSKIKKITNDIINYLNLYWIKEYQDENSTYFKNIESWVKNNNINSEDIEPAGNKETVNRNILKSSQFYNEYNTSYELNEYCNDEIDHTHILDENKSLDFEIRYSDKMICNISSIGTLYVIIKDKFK